MEQPKISIPRVLLFIFAVALIIYSVFNMDTMLEFIKNSIVLITKTKNIVVFLII